MGHAVMPEGAMHAENNPVDPGQPDPAPDGAEGEQLGEAGKRALAAERKAAREARQQLAAAQARLQEIEDADKSELQKATDAAAKAQSEADEARRELARERIARKHGLSDEDTELLAGDADAMERLAARLAAAGTQGPPKGDATPPGQAPPAVPGIGKVPDTRNISLTDQITAAEKGGDKALVATLKAMQLAKLPAAP